MKQPHSLMTPEAASMLAEKMNNLEDGDGWTYKAKHDPTGRGYSFVEAYDEDGELVDGV